MSGLESGKRSFIPNRNQFPKKKRDHPNRRTCQGRTKELAAYQYSRRKINLIRVFVFRFLLNRNTVDYSLGKIVVNKPCPYFLMNKSGFERMKLCQADRIPERKG